MCVCNDFVVVMTIAEIVLLLTSNDMHCVYLDYII